MALEFESSYFSGEEAKKIHSKQGRDMEREAAQMVIKAASVTASVESLNSVSGLAFGSAAGSGSEILKNSGSPTTGQNMNNLEKAGFMAEIDAKAIEEGESAIARDKETRKRLAEVRRKIGEIEREKNKIS